MNPLKLKPEHAEFARNYVADEHLNQCNAYQKTYPASSRKSSLSGGSRLMKNPNIRRYIDQLLDERARRQAITADSILAKVYGTVNADPNELVEVRRIACRCCHGEGHAYQFTIHELASKAIEFDLDIDGLLAGGSGYVIGKDPVATCPECLGQGVPHVVLKDTRNLSNEAKQLYAGAKKTKYGIEISMHARDKSVELALRHLGLLNDKIDHTNNGGSFEPMTLADFYEKPNADT